MDENSGQRSGDQPAGSPLFCGMTMQFNGIQIGDRPKVAFKAQDLFNQQHSADTYNIALQLLLVNLKQAIEQLWDIEVTHYTHMDFVINFGQQTLQGCTEIRYSIKMSHPIRGQVDAMILINPSSTGSTWEFRGNGRICTIGYESSGPRGEVTTDTGGRIRSMRGFHFD